MHITVQEIILQNIAFHVLQCNKTTVKKAPADGQEIPATSSQFRCSKPNTFHLHADYTALIS